MTPLPETATASPDEPPSTEAYAQASAGTASGAAMAAALGAPHSQAVASTAMTRVTRADPERLVRCTTMILSSGGPRHADTDPECPDGGAREHSGLQACAGLLRNLCLTGRSSAAPEEIFPRIEHSRHRRAYLGPCATHPGLAQHPSNVRELR